MNKKDPLKKLGQIQCFLLDMDGTLYLDEKLLPGAEQLIHWLEVHHLGYLFLTNNSSRNSRDYLKKLRKLGLNTINENRIITSGEAACLYLKKKKHGARVFILGTPTLHLEFKQHGFITTSSEPEMVLLGFDTTLTYKKLWKFCDFVRAGLPYYATHADINCPTEKGFMPDAGSIISLIKESTGREPDVVIGKPNQPMLDSIMEKTGFSLEQTAIVGDRLYTDMAMGRYGLFTILTLSGETKLSDVEDSQYQPDLIVENIYELLTRLEKMKHDGIR
jgi:4-nitrophenyl phosphatase/NagD protein